MQRPKPKGLSRAHAQQFCDPALVASYERRPPYPGNLVDVLINLIDSRPRKVLDLGCGTGRIARALVDQVDQVDAVDLSASMISTAKTLPAGDHPRIRWICAAVEEVELPGNYRLIAAGSSLHWMDWDIVLPRIARWLSPGGSLAIFNDGWEPLPWESELNALIPLYSTNQDYEPYDLITELISRELFKLEGTTTVVGGAYEQSASDYVEAFHGRNGFSRDRMSPSAAEEFDQVAREIVVRSCGSHVQLNLRTEVSWGEPTRCAPSSSARSDSSP